jgi:serine/threonine protein kinase
MQNDKVWKELEGLVGTDIGIYRVEAVKGRGNINVVLQARDTRDRRKVILKRAFEEDHCRLFPKMKANYMRLGLDCKNIEAFLDEARDDAGLQYLVLEYIEGPNLRDDMKKNGRYGIKRALEVVSQVLTAQVYSKSKGLYHDDINPGNVIPNQVVKVIDWGHTTIVEAELRKRNIDPEEVKYYSREEIVPKGYHPDFSMVALQRHEIEPCDETEIFSTGMLMYYMIFKSIASGVMKLCAEDRQDDSFHGKEEIDRILRRSLRNDSTKEEFLARKRLSVEKRPYSRLEDMLDDVLKLLGSDYTELYKLERRFLEAISGQQKVGGIYKDNELIVKSLIPILDYRTREAGELKERLVQKFKQDVIRPQTLRGIEYALRQQRSSLSQEDRKVYPYLNMLIHAVSKDTRINNFAAEVSIYDSSIRNPETGQVGDDVQLVKHR